MSNSNSDRDELRERLAELKAAADRIDALLANGRRLPAIPLARAMVDIDRATTRLQKHAATLAPAGDGAT
jgi:hypothetical protein